MRLVLLYVSDCHQFPQYSAFTGERALDDQDPRKSCGRVLTNTILSLQKIETQILVIFYALNVMLERLNARLRFRNMLLRATLCPLV